jgi:hypothetical protein
MFDTRIAIWILERCICICKVSFASVATAPGQGHVVLCAKLLYCCGYEMLQRTLQTTATLSRLCAADTSLPLLHPVTCSVLTVRAFVVLLFVYCLQGHCLMR